MNTDASRITAQYNIIYQAQKHMAMHLPSKTWELRQ